ncbi:hypothetical protein BVRB_038630, partial [Beta vulgaris subsp. vulgaris]
MAESEAASSRRYLLSPWRPRRLSSPSLIHAWAGRRDSRPRDGSSHSITYLMPSFLCGSLSSSAATPPRRRRPLRRRVLLLGIGGAGKSTIFRQIQRPPMSYKDLQSLKTTIHNLVIAAIKSLVDGAALLSQTHPSVQTTLPENSSIQRSVQYVTEELEFDRELLPKAARHIANLWAHPAIQRTYELRYHFGIHIPDSAP